jgi:hypothetical protein
VEGIYLGLRRGELPVAVAEAEALPGRGLVGDRYWSGAGTWSHWLRGQRLCEPCAHLERLTRPGVAAALLGRGGLRADILAGGRIRAGDVLARGCFEPA